MQRILLIQRPILLLTFYRFANDKQIFIRMGDFIELTCKQFATTLNQIDFEYSDVLKKSEFSICCIKHCLKQLKVHVTENDFRSQSEEIKFFKDIKPSIHAQLIYFTQVADIELKRPFVNEESQQKYLYDKLEMLNQFFNENIEFYKYIRSNYTNLDDKYFVRQNADLNQFADFYYHNIDHDFSTSHDHKLARLMASDLLSIYINTELSVIVNKGTQAKNQIPILKNNFTWTASKTAMIELIYALQFTGCINNGNSDIKEIAMLFKTVFNVELGDFYRDYLQIRSRQQPTKFLDTLKEAFLIKTSQHDSI
jgi:hypothetical protein